MLLRSQKELQQLKSITEQLLQKSSYDSICFVEKSVCITLNYLIKWQHHFAEESSDFIYRSLKDSVKIIKTIALSTQYHKFGHRLPRFSFLARRFEIWNKEKFNCANSYNLQNRIQKNELSQYYVYSKSNQISIQQTKNPNLQKLIKDIMGNQILFNSPQCICCSQAFIKGYELSSSNKIYPFIGMSALNSTSAKFGPSFDIIHLQRCLNALCNKGGGVLLIGTQLKNNCFQVVGIQFETQQSILQKQKIILQSINKIKPACCYSVQKILVYNSTQQIHQYKGRKKATICFRVIVFPYHNRRLSYIKHHKKETSQITYEFYELDKLNKIKKIQMIESQQNNLTFYTKIMQHYQARRKISVNSHFPIICYRQQQFYLPSFMCGSFSFDYNPESKKQLWSDYPLQKDGQIEISSSQSKFNSDIYSSQSDNTENIVVDNEEEIVENQFLKSIPHEINLKYKNLNMIIIPSKKQNRQLQNLVKELTKIKYVFSLSKPYQQDFGSRIGRQIWLISHEKKIRDLGKLIIYLEDQHKIKEKCFKVIPIHKCLRVQRSQKLDNFSQWFQQRFQQKYTMNIEESQDKKKAFFAFKDYYQSIYAYMIMQSFGLRPYFVNQQNVQPPSH